MDFRGRTEREQVAALAQLVRQASGHWGLAEATVERIKYRENAVFKLTAPSGERFVMRVHRPGYRTDPQILSEMDWMEALAEAGLVTPGVVPTRDGRRLVTVAVPSVPEPRQCDLLRWVSGTPLGSLEGGVGSDDEAVARAYELVGQYAARAHEHAAAWTRPPGFERPAWDIDSLVGESPTFGRFWELEGLQRSQREILFEARDRTRQQLADFGSSSDRYGLIHGDFLPENILMTEAGPRIIDFDDCGNSWYGFELATVLFPLLIQPNLPVARAAFLAGYRQIRPFSEQSIAMLPTFLMARTLSYAGWPAGRPEMEEGARLAAVIGPLAAHLAERYLGGEAIGLD